MHPYVELKIQFSRSVMSDSLRSHGLQHARPPCLSPTTGVAQTHVHRVSNAIQPSHPLSSFSSCPQSFPASGSFLMSQFFASGGQSIGVSASTSVLPMNIQDWYLLVLTHLISCSPRDSQESSATPEFIGTQRSLWSNSHIPIWLLEKSYL